MSVEKKSLVSKRNTSKKAIVAKSGGKIAATKITQPRIYTPTVPKP